jgi:hypothetical protein
LLIGSPGRHQNQHVASTRFYGELVPALGSSPNPGSARGSRSAGGILPRRSVAAQVRSNSKPSAARLQSCFILKRFPGKSVSP